MSALIEDIRSKLNEAKAPAEITDSIIRILEWWDGGSVEINYTKSPGAGFMLIGVDPHRGEVVMNLDRDRTGHIAFTPDQARAVAQKMITKAFEVDGRTL